MGVVWNWGGLVLGAAVLGGCGATERGPDLGPTAGAGVENAGHAGANTGQGGAEAPGGRGGDGGSSPMGGGHSAGTGGAPLVPMTPGIDPSESVQYRWTECGRIGATQKPEQALYAPDGSILILVATGEVRLHASGSTAARVLIESAATMPAPGFAMAISSDGHRLLRWRDEVLEVYAPPEGEPIGAETEELRVLHVDTSVCAYPKAFSSSANQILGYGNDRVCVWDATSGNLRASIDLSELESNGSPVLAGFADSTETVHVLKDWTLLTYTLEGERVSAIDLAALFSTEEASVPEISPDGESLLVLVRVGGGARWELLSIQTSDGAERWRRPVVEPPWQLLLSADGHVLVARGEVYRIEDGEVIGQDGRNAWGRTSALGPGGRTKLAVNELVGEWDLSANETIALYGSHAQRVLSLDVSRDGRHLASHGDTGVMWELQEDFAASRPLVQGEAGDSSWNVAIAPDGSAMAVSGDNVAFVRRDGSVVRAEPPLGAAIECLSPDWSFSPLGTLVAGSRYSSAIEVRETGGFGAVTGLKASNCGGGVAFSPDGSLLATASREVFETATWQPIWSDVPPLNPPGTLTAESAVEFSPDGQELVITRCKTPAFAEPCSSVRYAVRDAASRGALPELLGDRVRYSPEGHWLVSGNRVLHAPSGTLVEYATEATAASFTAEGDIIAGMPDGALVRYCRRAPE